jgi:hypothetical protein
MKRLQVTLVVALCMILNSLARGAPTLPTPTPLQTPAPAPAPPTSLQTPPLTSAPSSAVPVLQRIEPGERGGGSPSWSYLTPILSGVVALLGSWLGFRVAQKNTLKLVETSRMTSEAAIWQKANETELRDIQAKLDNFYYPFFVLLKADHQFAQDLRKRQKDPNYRLLVKLFDSAWMEGLPIGDRKLVEIVCGYAETLEKFINDKAGMVDAKIVPYLARASAHFRILHLAYKRELGDDPNRFVDYVYPKQIDDVLSFEIRRLRTRVDQLRSNPGVRPEPIAALDIPESLDLRNWDDPDGRLRSVPLGG